MLPSVVAVPAGAVSVNGIERDPEQTAPIATVAWRSVGGLPFTGSTSARATPWAPPDASAAPGAPR